MLVECLGNTPRFLHTERERQAYKRDIHQEEVWLEIGKKYTVYGVIFRNGEDIPWYLVCEDEDDGFPTPHLGGFFKIVDGGVPEGWVFTTKTINLGKTGLLPKCFSDDPYFMEKLVNEETQALAEFHQLKESLKAK